LRERRALGFPPVTRAIAITGSLAELQPVRSLPECAGARIIGPAAVGKSYRIVVLADYSHAPAAVVAVRAHIIARSTKTLRVHCDDLSVFDEVDAN
jgi:hypothetical protein